MNPTPGTARAVRRPLLALVAAAAGLVVAGPAHAAPNPSGSLKLESDPGDWVGAGETYSYSSEAGDEFWADGSVDVSAHRPNHGGSWFVRLHAGAGQRLAEGTYVDSDLTPYNDGRPWLDISGKGRDCNTETGIFVVTNVTYLENRIKTLDATFEQHCEGAEPALRGEVSVVHPDLVEPLEIGVDVDSQGHFDSDTGGVTVRGTVTCSRAWRIYVSATLTQQSGARSGSFATFAECSETAAPWQGTATSESLPFTPGILDLVATGWATDDERYGDIVWSRHADSLQVGQDGSGDEDDTAPESVFGSPSVIGVGLSPSSLSAAASDSSPTRSASAPSSSPSVEPPGRHDAERAKPRRVKRSNRPRSGRAARQQRRVAARSVASKRRGGGSKHRPSRRR